MNILAVIAPLSFAALAGLYACVAWKARTGTLPQGSALGVRHRELEADEEKWRLGHFAAWPILAMAALVSAFHAIASFIAGVLMGKDGRNFLTILVVAGIVVVIALRFLASSAAVHTVRRMEQGQND